MEPHHPITPPPDLLDRWNTLPCHISAKEIFVMVARWGADQELEACCEWIVQNCGKLHWWEIPGSLRAARRPTPPSLKEQALAALKVIERDYVIGVTIGSNTIRKALEALPND
jgi:hypothetical protein